MGSSGSTGAVIPIGKVAPVLDAAGRTLAAAQRAKDLGDDNVVYGPKPEITHVFRADPKSPAKAITTAFLVAVIVVYAGLFVVVSGL